MDGIFSSWDLSPGRTVAAQVRRFFKSTVHPSSSSTSKEFVLVATFVHASFDLTVETVALALQCCIGGDASCLRVFRLSDQRFRFSVASNHVGHFIYSLRERSWPDFQILFTLFRGDVNAEIFKDPMGFSGPVSFHS